MEWSEISKLEEKSFFSFCQITSGMSSVSKKNHFLYMCLIRKRKVQSLQ